mmetsp:Transcript_15075/g.23324  ORF Transcript_15075/g.23324 Transcript_15075/m.23324 type:complete len:157 (+) Transcript_15075:1140-1610(+)|eukprot:CAMPEP_0170489786 /NCGR_PEP_ID=MMETSP0208-20121228/8074_1 /TAXON_ID=197538 /ORGANISM="Strombidium inclinatum, Strain S3" /LENGTH=156 /DNA_ID=CAMNT_0010764867 /DNA_START=1141 /DNA_END=1611 /DNA_ORIENTATION=+
MDQGELNAFCRDFNLNLPKTTIHEVFKRVQSDLKSMTLEQFKVILPHIGVEFCKTKSRELKYRLKEIRDVLEYPDNRNQGVKISEAIEKIINDLEKKTVFSQKNQVMHVRLHEKITQRQSVPEVISVEELEKEGAKTKKILNEIEMILKLKKRLCE